MSEQISSPLPGPRGLPYLGVALSMRRSALRFFQLMQQQYGDVVSFTVLGNRVLLLSNPNDAQTVLVNDAASYGRSAEMRHLRPIFGNGLVSSEGDLWRSQRRRIQPSFNSQKLASYTTIMVDAIHERAQRWNSGQTLEIHSEMMGFSRDVVCRSLFGHQPAAQVDHIAQAITTIFGDLRSEVLYLPIWQRLPTPRSTRWRRAIKVLYQAIADIIQERRAATTSNDSDHEDMLGSLLSAQDEDGSTMTDLQIRDEVMTMFIAGHETSALSLTWAIHLLANHPAIQDQLAEEAIRVTADSPLTGAHYPQLKLTMAAVQETLRLYPPVWSLGRETIKDTTIGPYSVAKGDRIWICTNNIHRDPRWHPEPELFLPDRWLQPQPRPKLSFLPFGAGSRMCIGQNFAFIEATLALASLLRRFRFFPAGPQPVESEAWVTLRPKSGIPIRIEKRESSS
jgi:cytochrome P450